MDENLASENRPPTPSLSFFQPRPLARPLIPVTLALMVGLASASWGLRLKAEWLLGGLILLWIALGVSCLARRRTRLLPLALFWLLGVAFYQQAWQPPFPPHHLVHLPPEADVTLLGYLERPSKQGGEQVQLFVRVKAWRSPEGWRAATGSLLGRAPKLEPPPLGTDLVVRGRLRPFRVLKNPGAFDRDRYLAADGIFREIRVKDTGDLVFLASAGAMPWSERIRGGVRRLLKHLDPPSRAIYLAMLLGDQGEITPEMRQAFSRTGTSHLLVINGLHLSMVAAVTYFLSFWAMRRFPWLLLRINVMKVATLLAAVPVVGYAWVAGGSPSTQRAEVMVLAYLLLVFLGRPREVWSALALAALVILSLSPLRLFAISFQLSFVAVAAILYLVPRWLKILFRPSSREDREPSLAARVGVRLQEWTAVSVAASLATAPLVAAYFQVVSLLGVAVNLVAIPLVLGLALPLGEAGLWAQAFSLTPLVAQVLLALGRLPLWLGYQAISLAAGLPGSAIILSTPTWPQICAYYLIILLLFAPRRNYLTWAGTLMAALFLVGSVALPLGRTAQALEVTCLDTYGGLAGVAVSPEDRRLVFSAPGHSWPGRRAGGPGALPSYCHWRQFRRLDQVAALTFNRDNAPEMLALERQFHLGQLWFGRRGPEGPAYWELWNLLGDQARSPRSLERGRVPDNLGSVSLSFPKLEQGVALQLTYESRRALILPPMRNLEPKGLAPEGRLDVLIMPRELAASPSFEALLSRWRPGQLVVYGTAGPWTPVAAERLQAMPCHLTWEGAVSVYLSPAGVSVRQRRQ